MQSARPRIGPAVTAWLQRAALLALPLSLPATAHAAFLSGDALDTAADVMSWIVLIVAPIAGIAAFLLVHILPEKIAEKKQHPQAKAIQVLCLLSLAFGGLLWPMAWLWAYSKPVMYKMAYGTDKVAHDADEAHPPPPQKDEAQELRRRIAELEARLASKSGAEVAKA
jgi:CBS domain containing-hemolysin-like protein